MRRKKKKKEDFSENWQKNPRIPAVKEGRGRGEITKKKRKREQIPSRKKGRHLRSRKGGKLAPHLFRLPGGKGGHSQGGGSSPHILRLSRGEGKREKEEVGRKRRGEEKGHYCSCERVRISVRRRRERCRRTITLFCAKKKKGKGRGDVRAFPGGEERLCSYLRRGEKKGFKLDVKRV